MAFEQSVFVCSLVNFQTRSNGCMCDEEFCPKPFPIKSNLLDIILRLFLKCVWRDFVFPTRSLSPLLLLLLMSPQLRALFIWLVSWISLCGIISLTSRQRELFFYLYENNAIRITNERVMFPLNCSTLWTKFCFHRWSLFSFFWHCRNLAVAHSKCYFFFFSTALQYNKCHNFLIYFLIA